MKTIVSDLAKKTRSIKRKIKISEISKTDQICSKNAKTRFSLNFPIYNTCRPTKVCATTCYGAIKGKPITWNNSLIKQMRIYNWFKKTDPEKIADRIHKEYIKFNMSFLRWNGVGDLFKESVDVINIISEKYPEDIQWVVTRLPEWASKINRKAKNVYIMFSLDNDPESKKRKTKIGRHRHPRLYYSYLRFDKDEHTMGARIVFNAHQNKKTLPFDDVNATCPVDAGVIPIKNACHNCRKCFSESVLNKTIHIKSKGRKRYYN